MRLTAYARLLGCAVLLTCSVPAARAFQADAAPDAKAVKVRLVFKDFRYAEKSPALETIGGFFRASSARLSFTIAGLHWPPRAPRCRIEGPRRPAPDTPTFLVEGSLVTIKDKVRLNLVVKDASNDTLAFSNSAVFGGDTVVTEVDALAARLAASLGAKVGAVGRGGSVIAVVSPFQAAGDPGKLPGPLRAGAGYPGHTAFPRAARKRSSRGYGLSGDIPGAIPRCFRRRVDRHLLCGFRRIDGERRTAREARPRLEIFL